MKALLLLGSTGSIGTQTLDLVRRAPESFRIVGLGARSSWRVLAEQVREFRPAFVGIADPEAAERLAEALAPELRAGLTLLAGPEALQELAAGTDYDLAVHGVVGAAGVLPSLRVLERGRALALANKESLVVAGELLMELSRRTGAPILPVDSEHCAISQCLHGDGAGRVRCVYLTASGGALRDVPLEGLAGATPAMALRHPTWDMGPRITIDSATLMNKAFEVIETHHLYGLASEQIRVLLHRQSIVHSLVEFVDGSVLAQLGPPDMRGPLHHALHYPERASSELQGFDLTLFSRLTFEEPDPRRYPALGLGYRCVAQGGDSGAVLNAADEVAVAAFLDGAIGFEDVHRSCRSVLDQRPELSGGIEALLAADARARVLARGEVARLETRRAALPGGAPAS